jgi:cutinase
MKSVACLLALLAAANAAPTGQNVELSERQLNETSTRNDLVDGNAAECPRSVLVFARASGEAGNIVRSVIILCPYYICSLTRRVEAPVRV